ncbi:MAG TPA: cation:proton antiporter, partial [Caulobacteraceae bacterium]|nr:cation:proton antiporter [Caulobacteraceae bacterium]
LVTGAVLGPMLGLLDTQALTEALPLLAALAVITILFDGALEVTPGHLRSFGLPAIGLSFTVLAVTTVACGAVAHYVAGLPWDLALLLGLCFGGAGIAIIVPLARRMSVSSGALTVILLEAVTSDIFVIVGMFVACTVVASGAFGPALGLELVLSILIAVLLGPAIGWVWTHFLKRWGTAANAYTATLSILLLVYALTETLGGSGPLAVLLFGILVGNARGRDLKGPLRSRLFGEQLIEFHHEIVFFVRAAFFVSMGAVTRWELLAEPAFLVTGLLLAAVIGVCRMLGVGLVLGHNQGLGGWDKVATGLLFPMGLVTAAVSIVPRSFGIAGSEVIADYAAVVIVLTNLLGTIAVFVASALRPSSPRPGPSAALP